MRILLMKKRFRLCNYIFLYLIYKNSFHNKFEEDSVQDLKFERAVLMNPLIFREGKPLYQLEDVEVK